jgi:hypothetical protein
MKKNILILFSIMLMLLPNTILAHQTIHSNREDYDPLVDIEVTVTINTIRWLEEKLLSTKSLISPVNVLFTHFNRPQPTPLEDFSLYTIININDQNYESPLWDDPYIYYPDWSATHNIPDDQEEVTITINLMAQTQTGTVPCDLSSHIDTNEINIIYNIKTGHWTGDDTLGDASGYGRVTGVDDGTIYQKDNDAELWFSITQNDYDHDNIPYWTEVNTYATDPEIDNTGEDMDNDSIPIEWEHHWGYNPLIPEDHSTLDDDGDSITNDEEYLTHLWNSDPFRPDIFVELDIMEEGPNGELSTFSEHAGDLIKTSFSRQNIIYHLDNGTMGGHDIIPFEENVDRYSLDQIYYDYFLHGDFDNWRRGIFHYGLVVYSSVSAAGYMFRPNAYQISASGHEKLINDNPSYDRDIVYASAYMHELGHTLGFFQCPGHNRISGLLGILDYLRCRPYVSCMNYAYMYIMVDYSDGSRRSPDLDDWNPDRMRFNFFEQDWG